LPELRQRVADFYLNNYGVAVKPASRYTFNGVKGGIMHISMAFFLNEIDEVLIPQSGYLLIASVTNLVGADADIL
jgi:aspartate/methionine/tyrosine aminotransferase